MKLAIFGATGKTGRCLVEQALDQKHTVVALARAPRRLSTRHERLSIVVGDIRDAAKVAQVVQGTEAVLSALGPTGNKSVFAVSQGIDNILAAMKTHGVRRLIFSTGAGVRDPQDKPTLMHAFFGVAVQLFSRNVYQEMLVVVDKIRASEVDWTIVRVPMLTDAPGTRKIWSGSVGQAMGPRITRGDLAAFMLERLTDPAHLRQAPAISNL